MNFGQERRVWQVPWQLYRHVFIVVTNVFGIKKCAQLEAVKAWIPHSMDMLGLAVEEIQVLDQLIPTIASHYEACRRYLIHAPSYITFLQAELALWEAANANAATLQALSDDEASY